MKPARCKYLIFNSCAMSDHAAKWSRLCIYRLASRALRFSSVLMTGEKRSALDASLCRAWTQQQDQGTHTLPDIMLMTDNENNVMQMLTMQLSATIGSGSLQQSVSSCKQSGDAMDPRASAASCLTMACSDSSLSTCLQGSTCLLFPLCCTAR